MDLSIIPLKNNLLVDSTYNSIRLKIIERISHLGLTDQKYKDDNEFLTLICNLLENLVNKKDKISKKDLAIDILTQIFNLNEDEKPILSKNIDFICNQKNLIKKVSFYKLFKTGLSEWFRKK